MMNGDEPVILDFGMANCYNPKCGTPGYKPPECENWEGKMERKSQKACDCYALGIIMGQCILGYINFEVKTDWYSEGIEKPFLHFKPEAKK